VVVTKNSIFEDITVNTNQKHVQHCFGIVLKKYLANQMSMVVCDWLKYFDI